MHPMRALLAAILAFAAFAGTAAHAASVSASAGFDEIERALALNPVQKQQFEVALAATQRALISIALGGLQAKSRIFEELAKPKPDPDAIARAQNEVFDLSGPAFREAREEWQRFYAMLDADQVADARALIEKKLSRLERLGRDLRGLFDDGEARRR
jgi:hypothetical protein